MPFETYKNLKVAVTGHTGFKGAWLSEWLLSLGADVYGYSIDIPTEPSLFEALSLEQRTQTVFADIRDYGRLEKFLVDCQPDIVFHLAAQPLVRSSYDLPKETFDTNIGGTINVLEAIRSIGNIPAAVIVTTDKCYENDGSPQAFRESDRLGGRDPYSTSKACAEIVFSSYVRSFLQQKNSTTASGSPLRP